MKPLRWILAAAIAIAAALPLARGSWGLTAAGAERASDARPIVLDEPLSPAVVVATKPTLSEILDLILRERPTAADLANGQVSGDFPKGSDEAHIASILSRYTDDRDRVNRIAAALVKESRRRKIGSSLLVGVLLTENPWLDPRATSFVGARGLMQVMPFHAGQWGCASSDLFDIESNICHGVAVLAENLGRSKTLQQALLGYNGCVRGKNTPDCWRYPAKVFREARKTTTPEADVKPFSAIVASRGRKSAGS
jgi:hypothetical protein